MRLRRRDLGVPYPGRSSDAGTRLSAADLVQRISGYARPNRPACQLAVACRRDGNRASA